MADCTTQFFKKLFYWSRAARVTRFRGYAVSKSTGVNQTSPLDRHHPTQTLETMRFGVSNAPGGLLGPEISQVGGRPSWPSGVPAEAASGRAAHHARTQQAHHACIGSSGYKTPENRTMTCHAWWTGRLCAYIYKHQSDSIFVC